LVAKSGVIRAGFGQNIISESRWQTDEFPINPEFFREMSRQGFDAESFGGVMTSEQKKG
jgi:hypothetical protein